MSFKVVLEKKEIYDNCEKHTLKLLEDGSELTTQRVSFSNWQLDDGKYTNRVRQWADRRTPDEVNRADIQVDTSEA